MISEVNDDASDFNISLRRPENKHDGYNNYNNLVPKRMITMIVFIITYYLFKWMFYLWLQTKEETETSILIPLCCY